MDARASSAAVEAPPRGHQLLRNFHKRLHLQLLPSADLQLAAESYRCFLRRLSQAQQDSGGVPSGGGVGEGLGGMAEALQEGGTKEGPPAFDVFWNPLAEAEAAERLSCSDLLTPTATDAKTAAGGVPRRGSPSGEDPSRRALRSGGFGEASRRNEETPVTSYVCSSSLQRQTFPEEALLPPEDEILQLRHQLAALQLRQQQQERECAAAGAAAAALRLQVQQLTEDINFLRLNFSSRRTRGPFRRAEELQPPPCAAVSGGELLNQERDELKEGEEAGSELQQQASWSSREEALRQKLAVYKRELMLLSEQNARLRKGGAAAEGAAAT
ncbi:hypothetical protein cyc_05848 [Cyclospora cayetanensis]|uniref:Uncharacterized protein n=1 Tax=Cyclospora cayetanensis TaxID=88456 RepID=A0A1D3D0I7_9EIME|nr:hypothetical protein cyc_05848 [Cyclospora cayetanensis]